MNILLRFTGQDKVYDIPARDLTEEEIERLEAIYPEAEDIAQILVDTGVYEWAKKVQAPERSSGGGQHANH